MKLAYTLEEAAEQSGYGMSTLKVEIKAGRLVPSYANKKPVIRHAELQRWLDSLPAEAPDAVA